jgi:hypothetical protein
MACCGLSGKGATSAIGLLFFLSFTIIFGFMGVLLLGIGALFDKRLKFWRDTLISILDTSISKMWNDLMKDAYFINPKLKCSLSGKIYRFSPRFSGFIFKYFNVVVIVLIFFIIAGTATLFI